MLICCYTTAAFPYRKQKRVKKKAALSTNTKAKGYPLPHPSPLPFAKKLLSKSKGHYNEKHSTPLHPFSYHCTSIKSAINVAGLLGSNRSWIVSPRILKSTGLLTYREKPAVAQRAATSLITLADSAIIGVGAECFSRSQARISAHAAKPSLRGMCRSH